MIYRKMGSNEEAVSAIGFGTGFHLPENENGKTLKDTIQISLDAGVNFIDTAPVYGNGASESLLGEILQKIGRNNVFLASKVSPEDTSYYGTIKSAENSLKRLKTDVIDLFQVHWPNPNVPLEETMAAMEKLVKDGKIKNIGVSNLLLTEIKGSVDSLKDEKLATVQAEYNLFERSVEDELLPFCESRNIITIAYSPLAQGNLVNGKKQRILINKLSEKYGSTPGQLVLNWLVSRKNVIAIPNTSKPHRARENADSMNFTISPDDYELMSKELNTQISHVDLKKIRVSNDYNRKVYQTVQEAVENKMGMTPSPVELSEEMKKGLFLKPIRLKETSNGYDLVEGRLRYWAWVIAFGWDKKIPSLIWKREE